MSWCSLGYLVNERVSGGFLPDEDQGAFMVEIQLPEGSSVNRTDRVVEQVEEIVLGADEVKDVSAVVGFSMIDGLIKSNSGFVIVLLEPFNERADPSLDLHAIMKRLAAKFRTIQHANIFPFNLAPIIGLGTGSGFKYQLKDLQGRRPVNLAAVGRSLVVAGNQDPDLARVFTTYSATTSQVYGHRP